MSKYFNGDKLSGYEDSPITYVHNNIEKFNKVIADLKAQLAESEEQLKEELVEKKGLERALSACNRQNDEFAEMIKKLVNEKEELKQQLAEKDKELAYMTEQAKKFNNEAQKYFEDAYCNDFHKRDKISFAVEQLENVKEFVSRQLFITTKDCNDLDEAEAKGCNELREENVGQTVKLSGFVRTIRDLGSVMFVDLADHYGIRKQR